MIPENDEEREREIQAVNPLASINNLGNMHQTELVDFFSQQGALKISEYLSTHPKSGDMIAKLMAHAATQGTSKIHLPVDSATPKGPLMVDLSTPAAPLQLSAFVSQHPGRAEDVLSKIADSASANSTKVHLTSEYI
jgi:hypothetical protein